MATLGPESALTARPPLSQLASAQLQSQLVGVNLPHHRGLERALEEAAASGALNLSARKLKEFPRTAANHDLSDTVEADLSKNRLADVPSEVCQLVALESLNLYHNCIRTIPDTMISLQSLTSLNLSRNQLGSLPACICSLPLRVLNASHNKLVNVPEAIGQLHALMELDVSCNEISALPRHFSRLRSLRELNVRRNLLCVLPDELCDLPLVKLDFSCNKVSTIPVSYRKMRRLQSLTLENNPLQSPPAQICLKGKVHIFKYLGLEACRSEKMPDSLFLPNVERLGLSRPNTGSVEDMEQHRKLDSDSGVGSDNGDKRLSATEVRAPHCSSCRSPVSGLRCAPFEFLRVGLFKHLSWIWYKAVVVAVVRPLMFLSHLCCEPFYFLRRLWWTCRGMKILSLNIFKLCIVPLSLVCFINVSFSSRVNLIPLVSPVVVVVVVVVFMRSHRSLESVDPQFTMRRRMEQLREELELMEQLRDSIESRLKVVLPEDLGSSLMDGVVLCHLANHIRPRSVASIHVPSPAVPKLSMAKCRRNVENFLDACRRIGVPEDKLCLPHHILEEKGLVKLCSTVQALVEQTALGT
uniref:Leucine-rich repeats and calponin homology (CH) domain containing 1 n=1 Tax=Neogobius melanostomus TaxID=47308 RepID=A0A8C6TCE2_9GOBI